MVGLEFSEILFFEDRFKDFVAFDKRWRQNEFF